MDDMAGRSTVVTGAGRAGGLGAGIVTVLADRGARVAVADLDIGHADEIREMGATEAVSLDVRSADSVRGAFAELARRLGAIDILINNAGIGAGDDEDGWHASFEVNLRGVVRTCEAALATMRPRHQGKIINIASISGHDARGPAGSYGASKAALLRYTKGLAVEEARYGININAVCPGAVWTEMQRRSFARPAEIDTALAGLEPYAAFVEYYRPLIPLGRVQAPEDVGHADPLVSAMQVNRLTLTDGSISPPDEPGFGLVMDENALASCRVL
jgi:meso-butanediol dehydrogenase / (S,S)-butanediol dehydrogenase / diacetyl reductase